MANYARRLANSAAAGFAGLLAFATPAQHQRVVSANEITARAWAKTGASLRRSMKTIDAELSSPRTSPHPHE